MTFFWRVHQPDSLLSCASLTVAVTVASCAGRLGDARRSGCGLPSDGVCSSSAPPAVAGRPRWGRCAFCPEPSYCTRTAGCSRPTLSGNCPKSAGKEVKMLQSCNTSNSMQDNSTMWKRSLNVYSSSVHLQLISSYCYLVLPTQFCHSNFSFAHFFFPIYSEIPYISYMLIVFQLIVCLRHAPIVQWSKVLPLTAPGLPSCLVSNPVKGF